LKNSIQHIRAFLTVANTGSFAKAALELNLSPSALTVQIQQLEEWLGVPLLERSPRQVTLTAAGQNNRGPMEKLLLDLDNIVSGSRDLAALRRGVVTIAALPSASNSPALRCACVTWWRSGSMRWCVRAKWISDWVCGPVSVTGWRSRW